MEGGSQVWQHKSLPGERHFPAFTFLLSVCFYAPQFCWVLWAFHNCPQELAGQLSAPGWRRRRLGGVWLLPSYLALDLEQQLTVLGTELSTVSSPISGNPSELQLFCHFAVLEEALAVWAVGCPGTLVLLGVSGAPAQSSECRWGQRCHSMGTLCFQSCCPRVTKR